MPRVLQLNARSLSTCAKDKGGRHLPCCDRGKLVVTDGAGKVTLLLKRVANGRHKTVDSAARLWSSTPYIATYSERYSKAVAESGAAAGAGECARKRGISAVLEDSVTDQGEYSVLPSVSAVARQPWPGARSACHQRAASPLKASIGIVMFERSCLDDSALAPVYCTLLALGMSSVHLAERI